MNTSNTQETPVNLDKLFQRFLFDSRLTPARKFFTEHYALVGFETEFRKNTFFSRLKYLLFGNSPSCPLCETDIQLFFPVIQEVNRSGQAIAKQKLWWGLADHKLNYYDWHATTIRVGFCANSHEYVWYTETEEKHGIQSSSDVRGVIIEGVMQHKEAWASWYPTIDCD